MFSHNMLYMYVVNPSMCYTSRKHLSWRENMMKIRSQKHMNTGQKVCVKMTRLAVLNMQRRRIPHGLIGHCLHHHFSTFLHRMLQLPSQKACSLRGFLAYLYDFVLLFIFGKWHPFNVQNHAWQECKVRTATTPTCRVFNVPPRTMFDSSLISVPSEVSINH